MSSEAMGTTLSRRQLLELGAAPALLALAGAGGARAAAPAAKQVLTEPFARVFELGDGVWVIVSTPFDSRDYRTVCNGGIVAGADAVLVIEGFNTILGAAWVSELAHRLTGRWPTHVVATHFHSDHTAGLAGFQRGADPLQVISTAKTRGLVLERYAAEVPQPKNEGEAFATGRKILVPDTVLADDSAPTPLDLGGRTVLLLPFRGHTPSDVAVRVEGPAVVFAGDLAWTGIFPNYVDALPGELARSCKALLHEPDVLYVPGHGEPTDTAGLSPYLGLIARVEEAARSAFAKGVPLEEAWKAFEIPDSLGEWLLFRDDIVRDAFVAWYRELG